MDLINSKLKEKFDKFSLGSQEGKLFDAECIAKYFCMSATWFITEAEQIEGTNDYLLFGYADLGNSDFAEWGYVTLSELQGLHIGPFNVERDLYSDGKTVRELCNEIGLKYNDYNHQNEIEMEDDER